MQKRVDTWRYSAETEEYKVKNCCNSTENCGNSDDCGCGKSGKTAVGAAMLIFFIRIYQLIISPWLPDCCRFKPSCSVYSVEALRRFGFWRGSILMIWRVLRCNPFCRGGNDPVPEVFSLVRKNLSGDGADREKPADEQ